jgi:hypothetical protein
MKAKLRQAEAILRRCIKISFVAASEAGEGQEPKQHEPYFL